MFRKLITQCYSRRLNCIRGGRRNAYTFAQTKTNSSFGSRSPSKHQMKYQIRTLSLLKFCVQFVVVFLGGCNEFSAKIIIEVNARTVNGIVRKTCYLFAETTAAFAICFYLSKLEQCFSIGCMFIAIAW